MSFKRFLGVAALTGTMLAACSSPTAPRLPEGEKEDPDTKDPGGQAMTSPHAIVWYIA